MGKRSVHARRVLAAAVAAALASPAWPATIGWVLPLSGNWGTPGFWSGAVVPTAADTALITIAGTNTVSVSSGTFSVGRVQLSSGNRLAVSGGELNVLNGLTDTGTGGVLVNGGRLILGGSSSAINFTMSSGELAGNGTLSVTGSAVVSGGAMTGNGITTFVGPATITNTLSLGSGRLLRLFGGAFIGGTIDVAAGARLNIAPSATFENAALTGGGTLVALDTGLTFNTDTTIATRGEFGRVQFFGAGDVTLNGPVTVSDHLIAVGTGRGDVRFNGALDLATTNAFPMRIDDGRTVTIAGGATMTTGRIALNPGDNNRAAAGRLVNAAGSEFVFNTSTTTGIFATSYGNADNGLSALFRNEGVVTVRGAGTTTFDVPVQSIGSIVVEGSTLEFTRPSVLDGTLTVSGTGTMRFSSASYDIGASRIAGGAFVLNAGATWAMRAGLHEMVNGSLSGAGTLQVAPGALLDLSNFLIATPIQMNGGELRTAGSLAIQGAMSMLAQSTFTGNDGIDSGIFALQGGLTVNGRTFGIDRGAQVLLASQANASDFTVLLNPADTASDVAGRLVIDSGARWRDTGSGASTFRLDTFGATDRGGSGRLIINGIYEKSGSGVTTIAAPSALNGTLDVTGGRVDFTRDADLYGSVTIGGSGVVRFDGAGHRLFAGSMSGAGLVEMRGGAYVEVRAPYTIATRATLDSVRFAGDNTLTFTGAVRVDPGAVAVLTPATLVFAGGLDVPSSDLFQFFIDNGGEMRITGGGTFADVVFSLNPFGGNTSGRLVNAAGSTIIDAPAAGRFSGVFTYDRGGADNGRDALFTNAGTYIKRGAGETDFSAPFLNTGTVRVEQGTMFFSDDSTQAGALEVTGTGVLQIRGGTHAFRDGSSLNGSVNAMAPAAITFGAGVSRLLGGGITGNAPVTFGPGSRVVVPTSFSIANPVTLDGGTFDFGGSLGLNGPVTLSPNGIVMVSPGTTVISGAFAGPTGAGDVARVYIDRGHTLRIDGQATVGNHQFETNPFFDPGLPAGRLIIGPGGVFEDRGNGASRVFTVNWVSTQPDDGTSALLSIQGRYVKTGAGLTEWLLPVQVDGTIEVRDGTLYPWYGTTVSGAISATGSGRFQFANDVTMLNGSSLSGSFLARFATLNFQAGIHSLSNGGVASTGTGFFSGGTFIANPGARLDLDNFTLGVGVSLVLSGGEIRTLTNATFAGDVRLTAESSFTGPGTTRLTGALTMTAGQQLNLDLGQRLNIEGSATLSGFRIDLNRFNTPGVPAGQLSVANGATVFDNAGDASIFATNHGAADNGSSASFNISGRYQKTGTGTTTFGVATTIAGRLDIGAGVLRVDSAPLTHTGTIDIGAGARMEIANHGVFLGDPRRVIFNGGSITGAGVLALNQTTVSFDTDTVIDSALEIGRAAFVGPGNVRVTGPTTLTNHLLVIGGVSGPLSTGNVRFEGMVTMASADSSGNGSQFPMRIDDGRTVTFAGGALLTGGELVVNPADFGTSVAGRIVNEAGSTFVFRPTTTAGILNRNYGAFDDGRSALFSNAGTVRAEGPGVATIGAPFVNTGAVQVVGGTLRTTDTFTHSGTINVSGGLLDIAGGVQAGAPGAGAMAIGAAGSARIGAASTLGTVSVAAGGALTLDAALTINTGFTNANAGFGNAFNRRGGISGTGQLLAGGTPIQTLVGNGIADGSSLTPTITLGTMRAGTIRQYSFSIANTGNSPALRGALQTTGANGGNLTDAQLAFTPANFGPGSLHGLTFTPGSAGALSIAPNQRIAVVSQFDNVATQLLSITVDPNAKVYTPAVLAQNLGNIDFGVVRVGDTATRDVGTISNSAAVTALNDVLATSFSGSGAPFTLSDPGTLAGRQTATLTATLDTTAARAGTTQGVTARFASRNPDMADLDLGTAGFTLTGQVNNLAQAAFRKTGGAGMLTQSGTNNFLLDFGDIAQGATGIVTTRLAAWNRAPAGAPSDRLTGVLQPQRGAGSGAFIYGGFSGRFDLDTDEDSLELLLDLSSARVGVFTDTLLLTDLFSVYAGLADLALPQVRLDLRLSVIDPTTVIPLPAGAWLLLGGLVVLGASARRSRTR